MCSSVRRGTLSPGGGDGSAPWHRVRAMQTVGTNMPLACNKLRAYGSLMVMLSLSTAWPCPRCTAGPYWVSHRHRHPYCHPDATHRGAPLHPVPCALRRLPVQVGYVACNPQYRPAAGTTVPAHALGTPGPHLQYWLSSPPSMACCAAGFVGQASARCHLQHSPHPSTALQRPVAHANR